MHRYYGAEAIIYLFLVLGCSAELDPKGVAGCIFQYPYLEFSIVLRNSQLF